MSVRQRHPHPDRYFQRRERFAKGRRVKSNGENASPKGDELNPTAATFRQRATNQIQRRQRFAKGRRAKSNGENASPKGDELNPTAGTFRQRATSRIQRRERFAKRRRVKSNGGKASPKGEREILLNRTHTSFDMGCNLNKVCPFYLLDQVL